MLARSSIGLRSNDLLRGCLVGRIIAVVSNLSVLGRVQACELGGLGLIGSYLRGLILRLNRGRRGLFLDTRARLNRLGRTGCPTPVWILRLGLMLAPSVWLLPLVRRALSSDALNWQREGQLLRTALHRALVCLEESISDDLDIQTCSL